LASGVLRTTSASSDIKNGDIHYLFVTLRIFEPSNNNNNNNPQQPQQ